MTNKRFSLTEKTALYVLAGMIGLYVTVYAALAVLKYTYFIFDDFDLAIHDQIMWNILHGSLFNSILQINFLGNHAHLIVFLLAPLYKIFPHPLTLLFLQTLALGGAAVPLYLLAKKVLGLPSLGILVSFIYLIYPPLGFTNLYEYHPTVFATFFLMGMFYYFYEEKFAPFVWFMVLSLLCQENVPLVIVMVGFYALIRRRSLKWFLVPVLTGAVYFIFCIAWLMPRFNDNTIQFISLYGYLGKTYPQIASNLVKHPVVIARIIFSPRNLVYLLKVFAPLAFISLLSPMTLLIALPLFLQHMLSFRSTEVSIHYHYLAEMIPILFVAFVFGLKRMVGMSWVKDQINIFKWCVVLVALGCVIYLGPVFSLGRYAAKLIAMNRESVRVKQELVNKIPANAPTVATFQFLSHLTHRRELYSFHHQFSGYRTLSTKQFNLPASVTTALLDFDDTRTFRSFYSSENYKNILKFLSEGSWGVQEVRDNAVLFVKDAQEKYPLYTILKQPPSPVFCFSIKIDNEFEFLGTDIHGQKDGLMHLTLYWRALKKMDRDWNMFFDFLDGEGTTQYEFFRPLGYRIYPTQAWKAGEMIAEEVYMVLPRKLSGKTLTLTIGFFDYANGDIFQGSNSNDPLGRVTITNVEIH